MSGELEPTGEELRAAREQMLAAFDGVGPEAARHWPRARERRLVRRILLRTTREDLGWRGDLRLFAGFVRDRLRVSRPLRWVAASLLVHAVALPVCAYLARDEAPQQGAFRTGIELPAAEPFAQDESALGAPELTPLPVASLDADGSAPAVAPERVRNALQRDRFWLQRENPPPRLDASADAPLKIRLLAARSPGAASPGDARSETWLDDEATFALADDLERVLWTEVLLDRFVLAHERRALLGRALNELALVDPAPDDALGGLRRAALTRARAYGLWEAPPGFDPEAAALPLASAWRVHLAEAWTAAGGAAALPRAWGPAAGARD